MTPQAKERYIRIESIWINRFIGLLLLILTSGGAQAFIWIKYIHNTVESDHNTVLYNSKRIDNIVIDVKELQRSDNNQNIQINTLLTQANDRTKINQ